MNFFSIYPHRDAIIASKIELCIACGVTFQNTERVSGGMSIIPNGIGKTDYVGFGLVASPLQHCSVRFNNGITLFGFDICLSSCIGEEIRL